MGISRLKMAPSDRQPFLGLKELPNARQGALVMANSAECDLPIKATYNSSLGPDFPKVTLPSLRERLLACVRP